MTIIDFKVTYTDSAGVEHATNVTVLAASINAGIRKAVVEATKPSAAQGRNLTRVEWEGFVP